MNLISRPAKDLPDRIERGIARFAMRAALDAWNGGALALVYLKRVKRSDHYYDYCAAVDASYHSSSPPTAEYVPYECPECGSVQLGASKAYACCAATEGWCDDE